MTEGPAFLSVNAAEQAATVPRVLARNVLCRVVTDHQRVVRDRLLEVTPEMEEVFDLQGLATPRASEDPAHERVGCARTRAVSAPVTIGSDLLSFVLAQTPKNDDRAVSFASQSHGGHAQGDRRRHSVHKSDDLAREVAGLAHKTDDLAREVTGLARKTDDLAREVAGLAHKTDDLAREVAGLARKTDDLAHKSDDLAREVDDLVPPTDDLARGTDDLKAT
ncbi:MAG TPA: hypothetical protein VFF73_20025 [Planctomycetota bacterium]|nr:hypothetical protein [Planctomycetota bacterium]